MSIKRTIITTILALAMVATVAPAPAQADQLSDLMALVASLQQQIAALQGGATPVPTGIVACAGVTFNRTLTVGSTGQDVKCLQVLLNTNGYTLAATGAGSPGMETSYFGPATLTAVRAFQAAKGMTPANQVGPLTMAALNALIAGAPANPPVNPPVAGCPAGAVYNSITGALCAAAPATPGAVGFLSIPNLATSPSNSATVTATSNVPVLGVNIKAIGSNMTVSSAKVELKVNETSTSGTENHPAVVVQNLYVYDGSTLLGTYPVNASTVIKDSTYYYVILSGFSFQVPANTTKALTIKADVATGLETDRVLRIGLYGSDAVRGIDGAGAFTTATLDSSHLTTASAYRQFTFDYDAVGGSTLTVISNVSTPKEGSIVVDAVDPLANVSMLLFDVKSTTGASKITQVVVSVTGTASNKVTAVSLFDGSEPLGSVSPSAGSATFTDLAVMVAKDATKSLSVRYDFAADVTDETTAIATVGAGAITYEKPDLSSTTSAGSAATGRTMYLLDDKGAIFTLSSPLSATYSYDSTNTSLSTATAVITFREKAQGGLVDEIAAADLTVTVRDTSGSIVATLASSAVAVTNTLSSDIPDGSEATVTVTATYSRGATAPGLVYFKIDNIDWEIDAGSTVTQDWALTDYKTPFVNMQ